MMDNDHCVIVLVHGRCSGCGACAEISPDIFGLDPGTGRPFLKAEHGREQDARRAMAWCPRHCIEMEDPPSGPEKA